MLARSDAADGLEHEVISSGRLSSDRTTNQGAHAVSLASGVSSRARA